MKIKRLPPENEILVSLLAQRDAIFVPQRRFGAGCNANANVLISRRDYLASGGGLPWASGVASGAGRVRAQRLLEGLAASGMVDAIREGGRTHHVRLLPAGELLAGYLAAMPTLHDPWGWDLFKAILRRDGHAIPEDDLIPAWRASLKPAEGWTRTESLAHISDCLLPFLVREWVSSASTVRGNARYRPGPRFQDAAPPVAVELPYVDDAAVEAGRAAYVRAFDATYAALATSEPTDRGEIGEAPLSMSATSEEQSASWQRSAQLAARGS